jgi:hypothetical protein
VRIDIPCDGVHDAVGARHLRWYWRWASFQKDSGHTESWTSVRRAISTSNGRATSQDAAEDRSVGRSMMPLTSCPTTTGWRVQRCVRPRELSQAINGFITRHCTELVERDTADSLPSPSATTLAWFGFPRTCVGWRGSNKKRCPSCPQHWEMATQRNTNQPPLREKEQCKRTT